MLFIYAIAIALVFIFIHRWRLDYKLVKRKTGSVFKSSFFRETVYAAGITGLSIAVIFTTGLGGVLNVSGTNLAIASFLVSGLISTAWYLYLRSLDIYEPEKPWPQISVFLLSCLTVFLVFPVTFYINQELDFTFTGDPGNDFWYSVIAIGLVEEFVKIIPILLLLRFSKAANEPYDYILYGSISALGFAFMENAMYLERTDLLAFQGRALFASVMHMFNTSVICYAMAIFHFRLKKGRFWGFLIGLVLASLGHGFYDFWLLNAWANQYSFLTILFFLFSLHVWNAMKNNLINISQFFKPGIRIRGLDYKYLIIDGLFTAFFITAIAIFLLHGKNESVEFMREGLITGLALLIYITLTFGRIRVVPGLIRGLSPQRFREFLIPMTSLIADELGERIELRLPSHALAEPGFENLFDYFPLTGTLTRRLVYQGSEFAYLLRLDQPIDIKGFDAQHLLIIATKPNGFLSTNKGVLAEICALRYLPERLNAEVDEALKQKIAVVISRQGPPSAETVRE